MKERLSLIEGLNPSDPAQKAKEEAFVYGSPEPSVPLPEQPASTANVAPEQVTYDTKILPQFAGRVPVTTRTKPEVATALKRASLTRQLNGIEPYYVQDIMEEALETWLRANGYLST